MKQQKDKTYTRVVTLWCLAALGNDRVNRRS